MLLLNLKILKQKKILCSGSTLKLHFQKNLIEGLKRRSKSYNLEIIDEYTVFPPTGENYIISDLINVANSGICDSFLEISVSEALTNNIYHSPQIIGADTFGTVGYGGTYSGTTTFHYLPGYWGSTLSIPFSARLIDPKTLKKIWIAEGNTTGSENVSAGTLIETIGEKIIEKLAENGIIKER